MCSVELILPGFALSPLQVFSASPHPGAGSAHLSAAPNPPHIPVGEFGLCYKHQSLAVASSEHRSHKHIRASAPTFTLLWCSSCVVCSCIRARSRASLACPVKNEWEKNSEWCALNFKHQDDYSYTLGFLGILIATRRWCGAETTVLVSVFAESTAEMNAG